MIIAFIGPDMTGKSNIASRLSREIDVPIFKNTDEWKADLSGDDYYINLPIIYKGIEYYKHLLRM